ncbi:DUF2515 family protein [Massilia horti]|uniref:Uncharacterized protein n=1 Tax=Massilia horti TaxID=2562153 RepID=A0A4Y9T4M3_9BURK|nr:hypothetical protein [Massilia horti]TFW34627.1 hypothetical protein E4O92_03445 [Massilia horti]
MSSIYVPGKPNPYFPKHKFYGVKVYGSYQRIEDCKVHHYVGPAATVEKGIAAYVLSPEHLWATFQVEAEDLIRVNGSLEKHEEERNKLINAAYAKLWLADNRFQWAGLAAFASKQVGCTILHANETMTKNRRERDFLELSAPAPFPGAGAAVVQSGTEFGAAHMHEKLGFGNKHLFLDIYPLHRFFMERGWKEFNAHLEKRQNNKYPAYWNVDRPVLPFATPFREIREGFGLIEAGNLSKSVERLAQHEQVNILQKIMYNDDFTRRLLELNQYAVVTGIPTGDAEMIELTLSAQCKAKDGFTWPFSKDKYAKIWDVDQRMRFVLRAAEQFNKHLNGPQRPLIEESIRAIAAGGGVA